MPGAIFASSASVCVVAACAVSASAFAWTESLRRYTCNSTQFKLSINSKNHVGKRYKREAACSCNLPSDLGDNCLQPCSSAQQSSVDPTQTVLHVHCYYQALYSSLLCTLDCSSGLPRCRSRIGELCQLPGLHPATSTRY